MSLADRLLELSTSLAETAEDYREKASRCMAMSNLAWERAEAVMAAESHGCGDDDDESEDDDD